MSQDSNNPFQSDPSGPANISEPKKSKTWLWVLAILGVLTLVGAAVCCGGGYFAFQAGQNMLADAFQQQLQESQVIDQHIGEIESMSLNLVATSEAAGDSPGSLVFDIQGSKGSGQVLIQQAPGGNGTGIASAELVLPDGARHEVDISDSAAADDGSFQIDLGEPSDVSATEPAEAF